MITREQLKVGAEFIGYTSEPRVVQFVGDDLVVYKAGNYEYSLPIHKALEYWSPKPTPPEVVYLNIYEHAIFAYDTRRLADVSASPSRIACIRVEYRVGQLDE